jgi:hypothetical protein
VTERNKDRDIPLLAAPECSLQYIPIASHAVGTPFLGSADVKRVKYASEMLNIENEEYGMIGEDSHLFPDASVPLRVDEIIGAMQIAGPDSLQDAIRTNLTTSSQMSLAKPRP